MRVNPLALLVVAIATVVGAVFFGSWLLGLLAGLVIVAVATLLPLARL